VKYLQGFSYGHERLEISNQRAWTVPLCSFMCLPVSHLFWVSSLAYPNLLGTKAYVVVVIVLTRMTLNELLESAVQMVWTMRWTVKSCLKLGHVENSFSLEMQQEFFSFFLYIYLLVHCNLWYDDAWASTECQLDGWFYSSGSQIYYLWMICVCMDGDN
jgi:hypothetical protein